jgi:transcriptional regulator with XRE-family HTH domain
MYFKIFFRYFLFRFDTFGVKLIIIIFSKGRGVGMTFSDRLKNLRIEKELSQEDLSRILNITRAAVSGYETGRNEPSYEVLSKLSNIFDCSIDYLLGKVDNKKLSIIGGELLPQELRELGVEYYIVNKEAKENGITPEEMRKMIKAIKALKED